MDEETIRLTKYTDDGQTFETRQSLDPRMDVTTFTIYKHLLLKCLYVSIGDITSAFLLAFILILLKNDNPYDQSAVSLSLSMAYIWLSITMGLNYGISIKLSCAYGARNYKLMGLEFHRGLILTFIVSMIAMVIFFLTPRFTLLIGFDEKLVETMQVFVNIAVFAIPLYSLNGTFTEYFNAKLKFHIPAYIFILASIFSFFFAYYIMYVLDLGVLGAGITFLFENAFCSIGLMIYTMCFSRSDESLFWFKKESFEELWSSLEFMVLTGGPSCLEWLAIELLTIVAGTQNIYECHAFALVLNIYFFESTPMFSLRTISTSYIANFMGAKRVDVAKNIADATFYLTLAYSILFSLFILIFLDPILNLYTEEPESLIYFKRILLLFCLFFILDNSQAIIGAFLRATKLEREAFNSAIINIYGISFPLLIFFLNFTNLEIYSIVLTLFVINTLNLIAYLYYYLKSDWMVQADLIQLYIRETKENIFTTYGTFEALDEGE